MTNPLPVPADASTDAKSRAVRTLVQSLLVDVGAAVILAVTPLLARSFRRRPADLPANYQQLPDWHQTMTRPVLFGGRGGFRVYGGRGLSSRKATR